MSDVSTIPFEHAFIAEPVGKRKIQESEYEANGSICVVDQGQRLISGRTNRADLLIDDGPYIVFGDHTRVVKFVDFPFVAGADGVRLYKAAPKFDSEYLYFFLRSAALPADGYGRHSKYLQELEVPDLDPNQQRKIAACLKAQLAEVETARQAAQVQLREVSRLADAIVMDSVNNHPTIDYSLGDVLVEVKRGIGTSWSNYPVLGATRDGLAPAKEAPGKQAPKYKAVVPGTVFYNPMRILIGSIAFVDDDDEAGITSPDYVVLQGKPKQVDSRWFYYWLRSPLGVACINSLARGAVRERMLFNRLAEVEIELPNFSIQQRASIALKELKSLRSAIEKQLREIDLLPQKILAQAFEN